MDDVDRLLDRVSAAVNDLERENEWLRQVAPGGSVNAGDFAMYFGDRTHLLPEDVQRQKFRVALKGYRMRQVDRYLEDVIADLRQLLSENDELRRSAGLPS